MIVLRRIVAGLGAVLIGGVLVSVRLGLGSPGFGRGKVLLLVFGVAVVVVAWLGPRAGGVYRTVAVVVLNTVLLLGAMELGAMVVFKLMPAWLPAEEQDQAAAWVARYQYYATQPWGARVWSEYQEVNGRKHFEPYFIWQRDPFTGVTTSIGRDGTRRTPGASCVAGAYRVFTFGGSTMWGLGSPDWETIPAYLQAGLAARIRRPVCVVNFGDLGFVSSQSVARLLGELHAGHTPDLVIFYDGVNDVRAASLAGRAGVPFYVQDLGARLEGRVSPVALWFSTWKLYELTHRLLPQRHRRSAPSNAQGTVDTLAASIERVYLDNCRIVRALGREYGFRTMFFLQPVIWLGKKPLTPEEMPLRSDTIPALAGLAHLVDATYHRLEADAAREGIHSLTDVFDDQRSLVWIDFNHVIPPGNQLIAQRMLKEMGGDPEKMPNAASETRTRPDPDPNRLSLLPSAPFPPPP